MTMEISVLLAHSDFWNDTISRAEIIVRQEKALFFQSNAYRQNYYTELEFWLVK